MADLDRDTGEVIDNLTSGLQSVEEIFSTRLRERVMLREFGGGVIELIGRRITPRLFPAWKLLAATAIDLWEPRFRVRRLVATGSVEAIRAGAAGIDIQADFRPRGHFGDFTVERVVSFSLYLAPVRTVLSP